MPINVRPAAVSPAIGRDSLTFSGAQAEAAGPFTSISILNTNLSYRARVHGRVNKQLTLDAGLDMFSRATSYDALVPVNEWLSAGFRLDLAR